VLGRLLRGAMWSIGGAVVARGMALAGSVFAARVLRLESFGELGIIQGTAGMFGALAGLGLGFTATKHIAEFRRSDPARVGRIIGISYLVACLTGLVASVILWATAPFLAAKILAAPHLSSLLRLSLGLVVLGTLTGLQTGILAGFEAFEAIAKVAVASALLSVPMLVAGVWWSGLEGAILALSAGLLTAGVLNYHAIRATAKASDVEISFSDAGRELRKVSRFSFFVLVGSLMGIPINWICNSMLVHQPSGYEQMGIFNAANQWRMIILFIPGSVGSVLLPMMAHCHGEGDHSRYRKLLRYNVLLNAAVALLIAIPLILFAGRVLQFYGPEFQSGRLAFILLTLAAVILAVNNGLSRAIASTGAVRADTLFHLIWGVTFLGASWHLIPRFGASGLAIATIGGAIVQGISQWTWLLKRNPTSNGAPVPCAKS
jgi:O-antigen/teichoic acid export membrane protein